MGVQIDDSIRLTKFMHQNTTNTKHKQLAHTIFTTPNMTLGCASSLLRLIIHRLDLLQLQQLQRSTRSRTVTARKKTTNYQTVLRKSQFPIRRGLRNPIHLLLHSPDQENARGFHVSFAIPWITCPICVLVVRMPDGLGLGLVLRQADSII